MMTTTQQSQQKVIKYLKEGGSARNMKGTGVLASLETSPILFHNITVLLRDNPNCKNPVLVDIVLH
jgi:hypothetical protein